ncbi:MAG: hypothetical protein DHS20C10_11830 [marine bacterium B5-7]|nr:MAG: hypothetical protein DHS20C10_11830 [marine bacterium B5-7]
MQQVRSHWLEKVGHFLLASRTRAIVFVFLFSLVPFLAWVSKVIVGFVTLRKGPKEGALMLLWAIMPAVVFAYLGHPWVLLFDAVIGGFLLWAMACILRATGSWLRVLQLSLLVGSVGVIAAHCLHADIASWWYHMIDQTYHDKLQMMKQDGLLLQAQEVGEMYGRFKDAGSLLWVSRMSTGFAAMLSLASTIVNLLMARWWQGLLFNPGGLRQELFRVYLTITPVFLALLCGVAMHFQQYLAWDLSPVLALPLVFVGLLSCHRQFDGRRAAGLFLFMLYALLFLFLPYSLVAVVGVGMLSTLMHWFQFIYRKK